jgi:predicted enzyme related to lactoylglutathione lyase
MVLSPEDKKSIGIMKKRSSMKNTLSWFEIPVTEMSRAVTFYEAMLDVKMKQENFNGMQMAMWIPDDRAALTGALVKNPNMTPSMSGAVVYFDANGKLDECINRAREAGGTIIMPKTDIGDPGFIALIKDTEGNCVGLHAEKSK